MIHKLWGAASFLLNMMYFCRLCAFVLLLIFSLSVKGLTLRIDDTVPLNCILAKWPVSASLHAAALTLSLSSQTMVRYQLSVNLEGMLTTNGNVVNVNWIRTFVQYANNNQMYQGVSLVPLQGDYRSKLPKLYGLGVT